MKNKEVVNTQSTKSLTKLEQIEIIFSILKQTTTKKDLSKAKRLLQVEGESKR